MPFTNRAVGAEMIDIHNLCDSRGRGVSAVTVAAFGT